MKKILPLISSFLLSALIISSCNKSNPNLPDHTNPVVLPADGDAIISANNRFAFDFFRATLKQDPENNNKLISPLSIYLALSMVYNGADHATKDSMAKALRLDGIDINSLNAVCKALITQLPKEDNKMRMDIANSIWYRKNSYNPLTPFLNIVRDNYEATVQALDFDNQSAVNTINNWVSEKTNHKIPTIIDHISGDDMMYLINAIYFKGSWQHAFKKSNTYNDVFYLQDGTTQSVPLMQQDIKIKMFSNSSFTIAELPYGGGESFSMYVLKPADASKSLNTFAASLTENSLGDAISAMDSTAVDLIIPKWEYAYEIKDMKPELSMLGMGIAFGDGADFSKLYDPEQMKVHITKAIHKTYIKVNEEGTEAAAVTSIGMGMTSMPLTPIFKLDHPFLYTIIEKQTGAVLFLGMVNDPGGK